MKVAANAVPLFGCQLICGQLEPKQGLMPSNSDHSARLPRRFEPVHKVDNKAARDDSFSHRSYASHLTCGNARWQSRWLRFTSPNRRQRGKSAALATVSGDYAYQNLSVFVPGTKTKLRARGFEIVCVFVPGFVPNAYVETHGGIRRQDGQNRRPNWS